MSNQSISSHQQAQLRVCAEKIITNPTAHLHITVSGIDELQDDPLGEPGASWILDMAQHVESLSKPPKTTRDRPPLRSLYKADPRLFPGPLQRDTLYVVLCRRLNQRNLIMHDMGGMLFFTIDATGVTPHDLLHPNVIWRDTQAGPYWSHIREAQLTAVTDAENMRDELLIRLDREFRSNTSGIARAVEAWLAHGSSNYLLQDLFTAFHCLGIPIPKFDSDS